jgi:hypothetical protein
MLTAGVGPQWEEKMTARRIFSSMIAIAFGAGLLAVASAGFAAEKSAAEKKYDEQVNKCQNMGNTDERNQCLDEAMKEYQEAQAKEKGTKK